MGKIPCKLCAACGLYSDAATQLCPCGADLSEVPPRLVDEEEAAAHQGTIRRNLPVYVQRCSACGAENFTADPGKPVKICYNCHKARVAAVAPALYTAESSTDGAESSAGGSEPPADSRDSFHPQPRGAAPAAADSGADDNEDSVARWRMILGKTQASLGAAAEREPPPPPPPAPPVVPSAPSAPPAEADEGQEDGGWGRLLEGCRLKPAQSAGGARGRELTLVALRYGEMTLTLKAEESTLPFLLGRSAGCAQFLRQDLRVGNEHCYLDFQDGSWIVIDNHSANGTAVNRRFLALNGRQALRDGDELMLGHHPDSMAFRVGIR